MAVTKVRILFLASSPQQTGDIFVTAEMNRIRTKLQLAKLRDNFEFIPMLGVQPEQLLDYLNQYQPHIIHFSNHGSEAGEIILEDNIGNAKPVTSDTLTALFSTVKDNIKLVVLNSCFSRIQGKGINSTVDFVIAMNNDIGNDAAITFSESFYSALAYGRTIQESFEQAKTGLLLADIPQEHIPELLVREGVGTDHALAEAMRSSDVERLVIDQANNVWPARQLVVFGMIFLCAVVAYMLIHNIGTLAPERPIESAPRIALEKLKQIDLRTYLDEEHSIAERLAAPTVLSIPLQYQSLVQPAKTVSIENERAELAIAKASIAFEWRHFVSQHKENFGKWLGIESDAFKTTLSAGGAIFHETLFVSKDPIQWKELIKLLDNPSTNLLQVTVISTVGDQSITTVCNADLIFIRDHIAKYRSTNSAPFMQTTIPCMHKPNY